MGKLKVSLAIAATAAVITSAVMSLASKPFSLFAQARPASSYAEDRAAIEDLQARYLFAMDFHDPDLYVTTFTEDGILDVGSGEIKGRQAIKDVIARMPQPAATAEMRPAVGRHNISNIVIKVDGNRAAGRAYWFHYSNDNPETRGRLRRLRPLRGRNDQDQGPVVFHQAADLQREPGRMGIQ